MRELQFFILVLLALPGCRQPAPPPVVFHLESPFALKMGQTGVSDKTEGFAIRFDKIASDSRCPLGVQCITAGQAEVVLTLTKTGVTKTVTLPFTLPNGKDNVTDFEGHTIRVVGVTPFKQKDTAIKPEEYGVALTVIPTPPPAPKAQPGTPFTLAIGQEIEVAEDPAYKIRFEAVTDDSRCAEGAPCIWAGKVDCQLKLSLGDTTLVATLSTGDLSKGGKGVGVFGPYTLQLDDVTPARVQGDVIEPRHYRAILSLRK
ncbi:MAG: hypothetical protein SFV22_11195 [Saprospiraceae bacterium]|nr:hypothetical protein [Saprospiraceae bacterium]